MEKLLVYVLVGIKRKRIRVAVYSTLESAEKRMKYIRKDFDTIKIVQTEMED